MTFLIYMTTLCMLCNTIGCDLATMRNGKNLFSTPTYVVWEHPGERCNMSLTEETTNTKHTQAE